MSKKDMVAAVAEKCELTQAKAGEAVDAVIHFIEASMKKGDEVNLPGFGKFKVGRREARKGRNPLTKKEIDIPASNVPKFQPSKTLKDQLNGG
jgi:DNA-binding protein HU-beta